MAESIDLPDFYWLQPHLLSRETLINLLHTKCLKLQELNVMTKDELVNIFCRIAVPLPQRQYPQNRRGKILTAARSKQEKNRLLKEPTLDSTISIGFDRPTNSSSSSRNVSTSNSRKDRLKPPPDAINYEKKKIKLNSSLSSTLDSVHINEKSSETNGNILDKIIIKDRTKEVKCVNKVENSVVKKPESKDVTATTTTLTSSKEGEGTSKRIKLKRTSSSTEGQVSSEISHQQAKKCDEPDQKKQRSKITWP